MSTGFYKSIKKMEVNEQGRTVALKGSCKAKDLQKPKITVYGDDDSFEELGIRRMN